MKTKKLKHIHVKEAKNNFLFILAAFLVVALSVMSFVIYNQNQMAMKAIDMATESLKKQSSDDDVQSIDKDTNDTKLDDLDKELKDMDTELSSPE